MIYIEKIKIIDDLIQLKKIKKGFEFKCSDVNLFVGNQGCGKSTLLKLIQENSPHIQVSLSEYTLKNGVDTFYFDTEKDNPRTKKANTLDSDSMINAVKSNFQSHGEVLKHYTVDAILKAKDCVIILDEPESGLSITNQFNLIHEIWRAVGTNRCQFFIATHCYPLIDAFDVISLEHGRWLSGSSFIERVRYSD